MKRVVLTVCCVLVCLTFLGSLTHKGTPLLVKVEWDNLSDLAQIQSYDLDVRYCGGDFVLLSVAQSDVVSLEREGWRVSVLDLPDRDEEFYAAWVMEGSLPEISQVLQDGETTIIKAGKRDIDVLRKYCYFLVELPHRMSLDGWFPEPALGKAAISWSESDLVASLLDSVSADRLERDIAHLVYFDTTKPYDNSLSNLRTRYARHPVTRDSAAAYIVQELSQALGEGSVTLIPFKHTPDDDDSTMYNIVGTLEGVDPDAGYYIICGHYDSIIGRGIAWDWRTDPAPGADDNASGVASVMEVARILSDLTFPWSIKFIAFSGEELGLWGSKDYARKAFERGDRILGVINVDTQGYNNHFDRLQVVGNPGSAWLVDWMVEANKVYDIGLMLDPLINAKAIGSDHASFWARGYDAVLGIENWPPEVDDPGGFYHRNTQFHTIADVVDSLNFSLIQKATKLYVATLAQFAAEAKAADLLPDLAIFEGDIRFAEADEALVVTVTNLSTTDVDNSFKVRISTCGADSVDCQEIWIEEISAPIPPGGNLSFSMPWDRLGDTTLLVEVDPDGRVEEEVETNNTIYETLRYVPVSRIVVYPNPFLIDSEGAAEVAFAGLPEGASVEIFSPLGELVWRGKEKRREVIWNGQNQEDFLVGSGIYFYLITDSEGRQERIGKLAVIRQD